MGGSRSGFSTGMVRRSPRTPAKTLRKSVLKRFSSAASAVLYNPAHARDVIKRMPITAHARIAKRHPPLEARQENWTSRPKTCFSLYYQAFRTQFGTETVEPLATTAHELSRGLGS